ncbi:hypothetical protein ZWY2020_037129 [Hordeum vulgare]|nr:hypothetical protein ZWY2020_037129 [Hordeum vulgare]
MIGCGSVLMSEDMVADGYMEIINIDISLVLIEMMRKKYFDLPQLQYMQMDVRDMSKFSEESFDCAIVKGTLDCLMGSSNIWPNAGPPKPAAARALLLDLICHKPAHHRLSPGGGQPTQQKTESVNSRPVCSNMYVSYTSEALQLQSPLDEAGRVSDELS